VGPLSKVGVDQSTQDLRCFEKHVRAEDNRMGFEDYKLDLAFVHKGVVVELENYFLPRTVGLLEKGMFHELGLADTFCPYG
jgi:hypothetical protein